jgi:hypothetical protein
MRGHIDFGHCIANKLYIYINNNKRKEEASLKRESTLQLQIQGMPQKKTMVIIHNYQIEYNSKNGCHHIKISETPHCPICTKSLFVLGTRKRGVIKYDGEKIVLVIRRLYCDHCKKIHHELPDIIIPYKRISSDAAEKIISDANPSKEADYSCDTSTAIRIKEWFLSLLEYFENALLSLQAAYSGDNEICGMVSRLMPLKDHGKLPPGWLKMLVRMLVNSNRWRQTRTA